MSIFNPNQDQDELLKHLKNSQVDFNFDSDGIKRRLINNIQDQQINQAREKIESYAKKPFLVRHKWATTFAVMLLIIGGTGSAIAQADISMPGDRLHYLDQWHEELMLKLPLPATQKAKIRANIVDERNKELDYLIQQKNHKEIKAQAAIESSKSLDTAIEQVRRNIDDLDNKGKTQQAEKLRTVLNRLDGLATEQEQKIESLKKLSNDQATIKTLDQQLEAIKKSRLRTKFEN